MDKTLVKESWSVSWPMTFIMFSIFLIGLADVYVAGLFGKEIQAAYGLASQICFVFSIAAFALTVGTVTVVSQLFASDKKEEFNAAVDTSLLTALAAGIVVSAVGFFSSRAVIYSLTVPPELKKHATSFMQIYSLGLAFNYVLITTNGILRACKMVKSSLVTMLIVSFSNVVLNFVFAFHTPLGFKGIAVATVITTLAGCVLNLLFAKKVMSGFFRFSRQAVVKIAHIGWPAGILQVSWNLAAVALYLILSALPSNNVEVLAAFTNGLKVEAAIFLPAFAFNLANAVLVGNQLGRKNGSDAFRTGIVTAATGVMIISCMTLVVMINARGIAAMLSNNAVVVDECVRYIYISLFFEPVMAWGVILGGGLNGAGDTRSVMKAVALSLWLIRIPLSYFLAVYCNFGPVAVWWSMNASIMAQTIFISRRYFSKKWLTSHVGTPNLSIVSRSFN